MKRNLNLFLEFLILFVSIYCLKGTILRVGRHVEAQFTIIDTNYRVKANCVKNISKVETRDKCADECTLEVKCSTFNYHRTKGICELLNISKFDAAGLLQRDNGWSHYETDDDASNVGPVCERLSPCQPYQVCEDTYQCGAGFTCKCKKGFHGDKCQHYDGPGKTKDKRVPSCYSLLTRFRAIPNGRYWLQGRKTSIQCGRRVDGRYTLWSQFSACSGLCDGVRRRHRNCTNPTPAFGGDDCSHLGPSEESEKCAVLKCPRMMNRLNLLLNEKRIEKNKLIQTLDVFGKEFIVALQFKPIKVPTNFVNVIHITNATDKLVYGDRIVYISFTPRQFLAFRVSADKNPNTKLKITNTPFPLREWITVQIEQIKASNGSYIYSIYVNQVLTHSFINTDAQNFKNVKVFASSPTITAADGFIENFVIFQPDLCKTLCSPYANCSSVVGSYNCTCSNAHGWFGNGSTCSRSCLIEVMAIDAPDDKQGVYFHFDKVDLSLHDQFELTIQARNSRSEKEGEVDLFGWKYRDTKYDSHGRYIKGKYKNKDWEVGDLVMIEDKKYCPTGVSWMRQQNGVTFGAKDDSFGSFTLKKSGLLYSLKLQFVRGEIRCSPTHSWSSWGCRSSDLRVVIIDKDKNIVLPKVTLINNRYYEINGFTTKSSSISFHTIKSPIKVTADETYRIAFTEDLDKDTSAEGDNSGMVTVDVYAIII